MNPKELMLNNLLLDDQGILRKVAYVGETIGLHNDCGGTDKYQKNPIISHDINKLAPVHITLELLLKFGFKPIDAQSKRATGIYYKEYMHQEFGDARFMITIDTQEDGEPSFYVHDLGKNLWYIHQLQNFYFLKTGEEL